MKLAGRVCLIRLTRIGRRALEGVVGITEQGSFEGWVREQDEIGVWVRPVEEEEAADLRAGLVLVKWDYVATIRVVEVSGSS